MIQVVLSRVPNATMQQAKKCMPLPTRFSPNSAMPMKPASRKNAVSASYMKSGPSTLATVREYPAQLVPIS